MLYDLREVTDTIPSCNVRWTRCGEMITVRSVLRSPIVCSTGPTVSLVLMRLKVYTGITET